MTIRFRLSPLLTSLYGSMLLSALIPCAAWGDNLPSPPMATMPDSTLYLELVVNDRNFGDAVPVIYRGGHYYLSSSQLSAIGLPIADPSPAEVAVDNMDNVTLKYDGENQRLLINVPSEWLPKQQINVAIKEDFNLAQSSLGFLLNYDVYATQSSGISQSGSVAAWTEQRIFDRFGLISNTGVYRTNFSGNDSSDNDDGYIRFDTQWQRNDEAHLLRYTAGDLITGALPWSSAVRLGGIQIARNFAIRPDLITYPLPQFSGQAAVPSTVELYIDNFRTQSTHINPGPFVIDNAPRINGAGQATIVTTDALGRQISTSVPFYVASSLLKPGMWDFSFSAGALRRNYAVRSADYAESVASGVVRYGTTPWLTLEGRGDVARGMSVVGGGTSFRMGLFGVLNSAYSMSRTSDDAFSDVIDKPIADINNTTINTLQVPISTRGGRGDQRSLGYTYSNSFFNLNAQRITRSDNYGDLANYKSDFRLSRRTDQLTGSISLGNFGTLGSGYFDVRDALGERTRLVNVSYSASVFHNTSFYLSLNRELGSKGYNAQLVWNIPLGEWGSASVSTARDIDNQWFQRVNYGRATPSNGGLGWNLAYANGNSENSSYQQADVIWRTRIMESRAGIYGNSNNYNSWGELTGSLVMMNGGVYASNMISDAFALVSTNGFSDIPVSYENQLIGATDANGYVLIPTVSSYYQAKFQIDPMNLPADVILPTVERQLAISERSGYLIEFPIEQITAANIRLTDKSGKYLPKGSTIYTTGSSPVSYVGWDGMAYIEQVVQLNKIRIVRADNGTNCYSQFRLKNTKGIQDAGTAICQ
ncbi:fimbria/pilus outer membrane usher protein [Yersinia pekkanenii]|uniref:Outer membrane usher protein n=1 Tax=Yersinia pekkanenii TaxID=1288385 RepID=A0A0T9QFN0_9GAMM|nr:fimbria/pilus outer membrane usher protein [Yersinia pekkanenii]CNI09540.1 outer membrane usher protein [Yersinia pekkanenii]CRY68004.1 outer membrane usher protein [Yersinia pekkanenii]